MSYLVDTDWIIDGLSGRQAALTFLEERRDDGLAVSIVTLGELYDGAHGSSDRETHLASIAQFLRLFTVLPLGDETMRRFGHLRAHLRQAGTLIPDLDLLIGATAVEEDLILLTRNVRHYQRLPDVRLYSAS